MMTNLSRRAATLGLGSLAWTSGAAQAAPDLNSLIRAAYLYGFTPFEMARLGAEAAQRGAYNRIGYRQTLADDTSRNITTPNNDTLYASAWLDLTNGPVALTIPPRERRYFSVALMDVFSDNAHVLSVRSSASTTGRYLVAGPNWRGSTPRDSALLRMPSAHGWLLGRVLVDGQSDLTSAVGVLRQIALSDVGAPRPLEVAPRDAADPENFLNVVNEVLGRCDPGSANVRRARRFRSIGVQPGARGAFAALSPPVQNAWRSIASSVLTELRGDTGVSGQLRAGWIYPPNSVGDFGRDDHLRAAIALGGIGALPPQEAVYFTAVADSDGGPLHGASTYRWTLPASGVPVDAFWSLTMYEMDASGRLFFVANPINRFSIGDRTPGLSFSDSGSLDILISHAPTSQTANWLPAPAGPFRLMLRAYLPRPALHNGRWPVPALQRLG